MTISRVPFVVSLALVFFAVNALGKRKPHKPVAPVCGEGVCYSASGNGQDEYVIATDSATGKEKWRVMVFHNPIDPLLERDVQDVFITDLELRGQSLLVKDEKARCFSINLKTKKVTQSTHS